MPSGTTANLAALQRTLFPEGAPEFLKLSKSRLFTMCTHKEDFTGSAWELALTPGDGDGGSSLFAQALANRKPGNHIKFSITRKPDYVIGSIENEAIKAISGDNKGAIVDVVKSELELKGNMMGERIRRRFLGNAGGSLGIIESISGTSIVLTQASDMKHLRVGRVFMLAEDDGTGTSPTGNRAGTLSVVDWKVGARTIVCNADVAATIPGATAGDYLFSDGDYGICPIGIFGWIPWTTPTGSLAGVDRTKYPELTSGFRYDGEGASYLETITRAVAETAEYATSDSRYGFMSYRDMARFSNELEGRGQTRTVNGRDKFAKIAWNGIVVATPEGEVTVTGDYGIPDGQCLITDPKDFIVRSLGGLPHFSEEKFQQESAADAQQFRMRAWWNVGCKRPWNSIAITW